MTLSRLLLPWCGIPPTAISGHPSSPQQQDSPALWGD